MWEWWRLLLKMLLPERLHCEWMPRTKMRKRILASHMVNTYLFHENCVHDDVHHWKNCWQLKNKNEYICKKRPTTKKLKKRRSNSESWKKRILTVSNNSTILMYIITACMLGRFLVALNFFRPYTFFHSPIRMIPFYNHTYIKGTWCTFLIFRHHRTI